MIEIKLYNGNFNEVCKSLRQNYILDNDITLRINGVEYTKFTSEYRKAFIEERMKERMWEKLGELND